MKLSISFCSAWGIRQWVTVMMFAFLTGCGGGTHRVVTAVEHLDEDRLPTISISHAIAVDPVLTPGSPTIVLGTYGRN